MRSISPPAFWSQITNSSKYQVRTCFRQSMTWVDASGAQDYTLATTLSDYTKAVVHANNTSTLGTVYAWLINNTTVRVNCTAGGGNLSIIVNVVEYQNLVA